MPDKNEENNQLTPIAPDQLFETMQKDCYAYIDAIQKDKSFKGTHDLPLNGLSDNQVSSEELIELKKEAGSEDISTELLENVVPLVADVLDSAADFGWYFTRLEEVSRNISFMMARAQSASAYGDLGFSAVNFFLIPIQYLLGYVLGKKPNISFTRAAEFAYASTILGLIIAGFIVPGALPILGVLTGIVVAGAAMLKLGKLFHDRSEIERHLQETQQAIAVQEQLIQSNKDKVADMELRLKQIPAHDLTKLFALKKELRSIYLDADKAHFELKQLKEKQIAYQSDKKALGFGEALDRTASVLLGSLSLVGAILTLFLPPVGITILAASALAGASYLVARAGYPWVSRAINWFRRKIEDVKPSASMDGVQPSVAPSVSSTATIDRLLMPEGRVVAASDSQRDLDHQDMPKQKDSLSGPQPPQANVLKTPSDHLQDGNEPSTEPDSDQTDHLSPHR